MLTGTNIVCFAKDWNEDPTSNNHIMRLLARNNKVLWINSVSTRTPNLKSPLDREKIRKKLVEVSTPPREVERNLFVLTPPVLPFPHSAVAQRFNVPLLRLTISFATRFLGMESFINISFLPTAAPYARNIGERLVIYYCTDDWSQFSYVDPEAVERQEHNILRKADLVFTTSRSLLESKRRYNKETHLVSHGVDYEHFAAALIRDALIPLELRGINGPIIGFFGLIQDWIDIDLLKHIAESRPDWTLCLIGKSLVNLDALRGRANVILLDRRPYATLPDYCRAFDVAICPFRVNALTRHVNPIKLREYVAAGLPVVSTDIPECRLSPHLTRIAANQDQFIEHISRAIAETSIEQRRERSGLVRNETWEAKVELIGHHISRLLDVTTTRNQRS